MSVSVVTAPAVSAVTLHSVKDHLKLTDNAEDTMLDLYIGAAVAWAEDFTKRPFISRTLKLTLEAFPSDGVIEIPFPLVTTISSVKYYNETGALTTFAAENYWSVTGEVDSVGEVILKSTAQWPTVQEERPRPVEVTFVAGYGATSALVPADVRGAVLLMAAHLFINRIPYVTGTIVSEVPRTMETLLAPRRFYSLA